MSTKKVNEIQNGDLKKNVIVLRNVFGKSGQKYFIMPQKDKYGRMPSCVRRVNSLGDMILTEEDKKVSDLNFIAENAVITIDTSDPASCTFDLNDPRRAIEWEAIKNCFLIAPSRDAKDSQGNYLIDGTRDPGSLNPRYGLAELYVEIPGAMAEKRVTRQMEILKAKNFIVGDERGYDGHLLIARVLGRNMSGQPAADVTDYLLSVADKTPEKIIELYTGGDLQLKLLLITAKEKGVIRKEHGLFLYGEDEIVTLGSSENMVFEWMKQPKNQKTLQLIRQETYPELYPNRHEAAV